MVLTELINIHLKVGWKRGNPIWRVISPLQNASIRHLQEMDSGQVILHSRCAVMLNKVYVEYRFDLLTLRYEKHLLKFKIVSFVHIFDED